MSLSDITKDGSLVASALAAPPSDRGSGRHQVHQSSSGGVAWYPQGVPPTEPHYQVQQACRGGVAPPSGTPILEEDV